VRLWAIFIIISYYIFCCSPPTPIAVTSLFWQTEYKRNYTLVSQSLPTHFEHQEGFSYLLIQKKYSYCTQQ
jgi:hypothetical protein